METIWKRIWFMNGVMWGFIISSWVAIGDPRYYYFFGLWALSAIITIILLFKHYKSHD